MKRSEVILMVLQVPLDFLMLIFAGVSAYYLRFTNWAIDMKPVVKTPETQTAEVSKSEPEVDEFVDDIDDIDGMNNLDDLDGDAMNLDDIDDFGESDLSGLDDFDNPFDSAQLVICSLDFLVSQPQRLQQCLQTQWDLLSVDEAHHLK